MKHLNVVTISLALMFGIGAMAQDSEQSVTITGFSDGSASIGSDITNQLVTKVVTRIKTSLSHAPNDKVIITIVGGASKTGTDAMNYNISKARAEAVESVLLEQLPAYHFPTVTINIPRANGAEAQARIAKVSWTVIHATPLSIPPHKWNPWPAVSTLLAIVIIVATVAISMARRSKTQEAPHDPTVALLQKSEVERRKFQVITKDGNCLVTEICYRTGERGLGWYTPFPAPNDFRKDWPHVKIAVGNSLNTLPQSTIEQLIADGLVSVKAKRKGAA